MPLLHLHLIPLLLFLNLFQLLFFPETPDFILSLFFDQEPSFHFFSLLFSRLDSQWRKRREAAKEEKSGRNEERKVMTTEKKTREMEEMSRKIGGKRGSDMGRRSRGKASRKGE